MELIYIYNFKKKIYIYIIYQLLQEKPDSYEKKNCMNTRTHVTIFMLTLKDPDSR